MPKIKWLVLPIMIKTTNFFFNFLKVLFLRLIILEKVKNLTSAKKKFFNSPKLPEKTTFSPKMGQKIADPKFLDFLERPWKDLHSPKFSLKSV